MTRTRYMKSGRLAGHQPEKRPLPEIDSRQATITVASPHHRAAPRLIIVAARRRVTEVAS